MHIRVVSNLEYKTNSSSGVVQNGWKSSFFVNYFFNADLKTVLEVEFLKIHLVRRDSNI